jgi:hypothetical protein
MENNIPEVFQLLREPNRSGEYFYKNLNGITLTVDQKNWLCREVEKKNGERIDSIHTKIGLIKRYSLNRKFFDRNWKSYKKNGTTNGTGPPGLISMTEKLRLGRLITTNRQNGTENSEVELRNELTASVKASSKEKGKILAGYSGVSNTLYNNYVNKEFVQVRTQDMSTDARDKACKCPLMSYMWYLICFAVSGHLPPTHKWNADGSTYNFEMNTKTKLCRFKPEDELKYVAKEEITIKNNMSKGSRNKATRNSIGFAIKVMHMSSAAGEASPFVAVIAIDTLNKETNEWHCEEVVGLSYTADIGRKGYIYFAHDRAGTRDMWKHYFTNVVIPTIAQSSSAHNFNKLGEPETIPVMFSTDGEDIVIVNGYQDDLVGLFDTHNISYCRVGAGTTGIHQAGDRQYTFRETKKFVSTATRNKMEVHDQSRERNIENAFRGLVAKFPQTTATATADFRKRMTYGLLLLIKAYQRVTPDMIAKGFEVSGQSRLPDENGVTVDFDCIMAQCYTDIPKAQLELMQELTDYFVDIIKNQGTVNYHQFLEKGIQPGTTSINRDDLTHVRHWSEIINQRRL